MLKFQIVNIRTFRHISIVLSLFHQSALAFGMETTGQRRRQSHWPLYERSCGSNQRPSMTIRRSIDCTVGKGKAECRPATLRPFRSRRDQRHQCPTGYVISSCCYTNDTRTHGHIGNNSSLLFTTHNTAIAMELLCC
uniref:Putative secreted protein n=1 Tax=Ixodes ricinus TaxID=34613 RepID=A0A6B0USJ9_IXORI